MELRVVLYVAVYVLLVEDILWDKVSVDETLESAVLCVNTSAGSDSHSGTAAQPPKTFAPRLHSQSTNKSSIGAKLTINPGSYQKSILINANSSGRATQRITLQPATNGTVIG